MTSPTQSAMEQQQREALSACLEILQVIRPDYFRVVHGNQNGCDFDFEVCEQCGAAGDPPAHAKGCFSEKLDAAIRSADDVLAVSLDQASELRSLRDSLALARSRIAELEGGPKATPTDAQIRVFAEEMGMWVEPHEAERESGVEVECSISPEDAERLNAEFIATIREAWARAFGAPLSARAALNKEQP